MKKIVFSKVLQYLTILLDLVFIFTLTILNDLTEYANTNKEIYVPKSSNARIISYFSNQNVTKMTRFDAYFLNIFGYAQHGYLDIKSTVYTKIDFLHALTISKPVMMHIKLVPGETTFVFLKDLSKTYDLNFTKLEGEFNKTAPFYDGFLIPDTYDIPKGDNEKAIINYVSSESNKTHIKLMKDAFNEINYDKWKDIIVKASIIQKEAANSKEMPIVASVIENRIKNNMKLQMDGALNYGEFSHSKVTSERIKTDTSKFNTYMYFGLPDEPVCTPSITAIKAALKPEDTDYLYFVRNKKTKEHIFTKSYEEHLKNIKISNEYK